MTVVVERVVLLDLTAVGSFEDVSVAGVDSVALCVLDGETWDTGEVAVEQVVGGDGVAFDDAVTLKAASPSKVAVKVGEVTALRLRVSAAGDGFGRVALVGKETQAWQR